MEVGLNRKHPAIRRGVFLLLCAVDNLGFTQDMDVGLTRKHPAIRRGVFSYFA